MKDKALQDAEFAIQALSTQLRSWRIDPVINVEYILEQIKKAKEDGR